MWLVGFYCITAPGAVVRFVSVDLKSNLDIKADKNGNTMLAASFNIIPKSLHICYVSLAFVPSSEARY